MTIIAAKKEEVVQALPLLRAALEVSEGADIEITRNKIILSIECDVHAIMGRAMLGQFSNKADG